MLVARILLAEGGSKAGRNAGWFGAFILVGLVLFGFGGLRCSGFQFFGDGLRFYFGLFFGLKLVDAVGRGLRLGHMFSGDESLGDAMMAEACAIARTGGLFISPHAWEAVPDRARF